MRYCLGGKAGLDRLGMILPRMYTQEQGCYWVLFSIFTKNQDMKIQTSNSAQILISIAGKQSYKRGLLTKKKKKLQGEDQPNYNVKLLMNGKNSLNLFSWVLQLPFGWLECKEKRYHFFINFLKENLIPCIHWNKQILQTLRFHWVVLILLNHLFF